MLHEIHLYENATRLVKKLLYHIPQLFPGH